MNKFIIRFIEEPDYAGALAVYAPYVLHTAITFEYEVPSLEEFSSRVRTISKQYPYLVCESDGQIVAYCFGSIHRTKTAYRWSVESTIYMNEAYHHRGCADAMYRCLFDILKLQGFVNAYAGVSVPDGKSDKFHPKFGFKYLGCFPKIGFKHGKWHDLKWYEYNLAEHRDDLAAPVAITEIRDSEAVENILSKANERLR
jgi:phosphinothricin acetyltransferase